MNVFQRYAHIFWIPFFPIGKTGISQCGHCKQVLKKNQMPASLSLSYDNAKTQTRIPVWTFSGVFLIAIIAVWATVNEQAKKQTNAKIILSPKKDDVFEVKTKDDQYTLFKVQKVSGDTVYLRVNQFQTDRESGLADIKIKGDTAYAELPESVLKSRLKAMVDEGSIIDIQR